MHFPGVRTIGKQTCACYSEFALPYVYDELGVDIMRSLGPRPPYFLVTQWQSNTAVGRRPVF